MESEKIKYQNDVNDQLETINEEYVNSDDTEQDEEEFELDTVDEMKLLNSINGNNNEYFYHDQSDNEQFMSNIGDNQNVDELRENEQKVEHAISQLPSSINALLSIVKEIAIEPVKNPIEIIKKKYNANDDLVNKINSLYEFKTVYILDDSTSMNNILNDSPLNTTNEDKVKRWDELIYFSSISMEIANLINEKGSSDVYFLNREPILNVTDVDEFVEKLKLIKPRGYTPLNKVLQTCINNNVDVIKNKKLLVKIITDGEPTDDVGKPEVETFYKTLKAKNHDKIYITMVACTDDKKSMSYMTEWDKTIKHLDIVDDYKTVKEQILKSKGPNYQFSYGDYVIKTFVGSFDQEMDQIDAKRNIFHYAWKRLKHYKMVNLKV